MSKRKSADANDLGVDDLKQVRLRAYLVNMFRVKKRCFTAAWYRRWYWLEYSIKFDAVFAFLATILNLKECIMNQLLQPIAIVIRSLLLKIPH